MKTIRAINIASAEPAIRVLGRAYGADAFWMVGAGDYVLYRSERAHAVASTYRPNYSEPVYTEVARISHDELLAQREREALWTAVIGSIEDAKQALRRLIQADGALQTGTAEMAAVWMLRQAAAMKIEAAELQATTEGAEARTRLARRKADAECSETVDRMVSLALTIAEGERA